MFYKWRINRLKRKIAILENRLDNLNKLGNTSSYYVDKALFTADDLAGLKFDLGRLEDKS